MINEDRLVEGGSYYTVAYFDARMNVPEIETYIYVGKNLLPSDKGAGADSWYFQDPETYFEKGLFTQFQGNAGVEVLRADPDALEGLYDLEGLIAELSDIRRKGVHI